ncbi:MAG: flagellar assembly protein FliW [Desulfobulbaceae bacterium]|nr:flagellar assembly protein FliW [Desulfobulbaceae bacterium]
MSSSPVIETDGPVENDTPEKGSDTGEIRVMTSRFGEITVSPDKVIVMTSPFLGFPESRQFVLRAHGPDSPFMWFQSLDNPGLAFVVVQSGVIDPGYRPVLAPVVKNDLQLEAIPGKQELLIILTIPQGRPQDMTANFLGPVVINTEKRLAKQVLLDPAKYNACHQVIPAKATP